MPCKTECTGGKIAGNHCCLVWCVCLLWFISMFAITFSIISIICIGDLLICTGMDIINAFVLLCGIVMLPTNLHLMYYISQSKKIRHNSKTACCPLWMAIIWIIIICIAGIALCVRRMISRRVILENKIGQIMANYRNSYTHKRLMDNLQWSLKCCGLNSYKDWFNVDWYDKTRDYEWPTQLQSSAKTTRVTDSVPLSCCKSGSCISNYLAELGTSSINTHGCGSFLHHLIMISLSLHIAVFLLIILLECIILSCVFKDLDKKSGRVSSNKNEDYDVRQLMDIKDNFSPSSESYIAAADESDEEYPKGYHYENY